MDVLFKVCWIQDLEKLDWISDYLFSFFILNAIYEWIHLFSLEMMYIIWVSWM